MTVARENLPEATVAMETPMGAAIAITIDIPGHSDTRTRHSPIYWEGFETAHPLLANPPTLVSHFIVATTPKGSGTGVRTGPDRSGSRSGPLRIRTRTWTRTRSRPDPDRSDPDRIRIRIGSGSDRIPTGSGPAKTESCVGAENGQFLKCFAKENSNV